MKRWILLIFCINQTLEARCENIQRKIEKIALNSFAPCAVLAGKIERLYGLKNGLINLRVLYNAMTRVLTNGEAEILEKTAVKNEYFKAGEGAGRLRGVSRILKRCEGVLTDCGFDVSRFERTYPYLMGKTLKKTDKQQQKPQQLRVAAECGVILKIASRQTVSRF